MISFLRQILHRNGYLLIAAAWLFTLAFIYHHFIAQKATPKGVQTVLQHYLEDRESDFDRIVGDSLLMRRLVEKRGREEDWLTLTKKDYSILIYQRQFNNSEPPALIFWNNNTCEPTDSLLVKPDESGPVKLANGEYEYVIRNLGAGISAPVVVVALIPVHHRYTINTLYVKNAFAAGLDVENWMTIGSEPTGLPLQTGQGKPLYYLSPKDNYEKVSAQQPAILNGNWLYLCFCLLGTLLVLFFFHVTADTIAQRSPVKAILFLIIVLTVLRAISYFTSIPINSRAYTLFSADVYGSDSISRSLGDLLINSVLYLWLVLFAREHLSNIQVLRRLRREWLQWVYVLFCLSGLLGLTLFTGISIRNLVTDSAGISFNVMEFFTLGAYSLAGFLVLCCLVMGYFFLSMLILRSIAPFLQQRPALRYLYIAALGLLVLSFRMDVKAFNLEILLVIWLLLYMWLLDIPMLALKRGFYRIGVVVFWSFFFSISVAGLIVRQNAEKERGKRRYLAEKLLLQGDPTRISMVNLALQHFSDTFLYNNFDRLRDSSFRNALKLQSNSRMYGYLTPDFYVFDSARKPIYTDESSSFDSLSTVYDVGKNLESELRSLDVGFDKLGYIWRKEVRDTANAGTIKGYLFLVIKPQSFSSEALAPELFRLPNTEAAKERELRYSWAIYKDSMLENTHKSYDFATKLDPEFINSLREENYFTTRKGYSELWYRVVKNNIVLVVKKDQTLLEVLTLFAYLFCLFIFLAAIIRGINLLLRSRFRWQELKSHFQFNIRAQVHTTIIFVSLVSFIVIGAATIQFFINRYERNKVDKLNKAMEVVISEIKQELPSHQAFDDELRLIDEGANTELKKKVKYIAEVHGTDINVFDDITGRLSIPSSNMYEMNILANRISPMAYFHLKQQNRQSYVADEKIGGLDYMSIYSAVLNEKGNTQAFVNIPYYQTTKDLQQEISNFLVTIINLNALIFLMAGGIALFITNRITRSFSLIGDKMQQISLGQINEEIPWEKNDEIGVLVKEYNKMVRKLETSAATLARSEREGAWREMARQVAHEIKNPLTPMKLSIQYLQKSIDNNSPNVKELSGNVATTLIEQIEHLSKIAADFSQFANIGFGKIEVFDIHHIIGSLISLYDSNEKLTIDWNPIQEKALVNTDRTHMNRLFTNLLQNAVEACTGKKECRVTINEAKVGGKLVISIEDNGEGIPWEMQSKIFTPNFTTKTSGTGLGLAMCKGIVEQAKGNIWFETAIGRGTTFIVELPLHDEQGSGPAPVLTKDGPELYGLN